MSVINIPFVVVAVAWLHVADAVAGSYDGPIFDAHGHMGGSFDPATINRVMESNNVTRQLLMARYYPGPASRNDLPGRDELSLKMAASNPGRFLPLVGMQRPMLTGSHKWHNPTRAIEALLKETEQKLATGKFFGIGELIVRHFAYSKGRHAELDNPIYSTFTKRLSNLAMRFDVPIVIHMEGEPGLVADFSRLMDEYKTVRYVWAHNCGRSQAPVIREMLTRHPYLMCDLGGMVNFAPRGYGYGTGWPRKEAYTALMEENGRFFPEMQAVYEDFSERFMIGTDIAHAPVMNERVYRARIQRFRRLLGTLNPETAKLIAEGNALRIFKVKN